MWTCYLCFSAIPRKLFCIFHRWTSARSSLGSWCSIEQWHCNSVTSLCYRKFAKTWPYKKSQPLPPHLPKIWSPNPALGATNLRDIIWISPTGKGEAGRDASFDLVSCPSLYFHSAEEKSRWTEEPTQPPGSGRRWLERGLKRNENWCKPFAEGYAATEAVPSPQRSMMRYLTCSLVLVFSQEQIWGQLINLSASD